MTPMWPSDEKNIDDGYTPLECFVYFDSRGETLPCKDIRKFKSILHGKEMVNLQIKMWVDSFVDGFLLVSPEEIKEICRDYPEWVYKSYCNQLKKTYLKNIGFVPSFIKEQIGDK